MRVNGIDHDGIPPSKRDIARYIAEQFDGTNIKIRLTVPEQSSVVLGQKFWLGPLFWEVCDAAKELGLENIPDDFWINSETQEFFFWKKGYKPEEVELVGAA